MCNIYIYLYIYIDIYIYIYVPFKFLNKAILKATDCMQKGLFCCRDVNSDLKTDGHVPKDLSDLPSHSMTLSRRTYFCSIVIDRKKCRHLS